jgi:hypothetical protein
MSFRVSALVAAVVTLSLSSMAPVSAQPQAPFRPRTSPFGSIFSPGLQQQQFQQQLFLNQALGGGGAVPGFGVPGFGGQGFGGGFPGGPGFGNLGQLAYQPAFPGAYAPAGALQARPASTFNNLGHWYGNRYGSYGHWYPNGIANGRGVLASSGGLSGGLYGGLGGSSMGGGPARMGSSMVGNAGGTALGVGAMMNQFRR